MHNSWRCPTLSALPPSPTGASRPSGNVLMYLIIYVNVYMTFSATGGIPTRTGRFRTPLCSDLTKVTSGWSLVFGGCAFPPVSLGPAGDCPCRD